MILIEKTSGYSLGSANLTVCLFALAVCIGAYVYTSGARQTLRWNSSLRVDLFTETLVIVPFDRWSSITKRGLSLALQLTGQVRIVHVAKDGGEEELESLWEQNVVSPLTVAGRTIPELVILKQSSDHAASSIAEYILTAEREDPSRQIVVIVPEVAVRHWWQRVLHNHRSRFLKLVLSARGSRRIMIIDVPWYL